MKPSHYHYIKRMWTRYALSQNSGCCLGSILKLLAVPLVLCLIISFSPVLLIIALVVIMILIIDRISYSKNPLQYYKNHYDALNEVQRDKYKTLLDNEIKEVKELAHILNTTTHIEEFVDSFEDIIYTLEILIEHECTGFFSINKPTKDLNRILNNRHLTEIDFIKRTYAYIDSKYSIPSKDMEYIQDFTTRAQEFARTGIYISREEKPVKKHLSDYELELFAKQCNIALEYEDKKECWQSESDEI